MSARDRTFVETWDSVESVHTGPMVLSSPPTASDPGGQSGTTDSTFTYVPAWWGGDERTEHIVEEHSDAEIDSERVSYQFPKLRELEVIGEYRSKMLDRVYSRGFEPANLSKEETVRLRLLEDRLDELVPAYTPGEIDHLESMVNLAERLKKKMDSADRK